MTAPSAHLPFWTVLKKKSGEKDFGNSHALFYDKPRILDVFVLLVDRVDWIGLVVGRCS
jgi:hypothetical protein